MKTIIFLNVKDPVLESYHYNEIFEVIMIPTAHILVDFSSTSSSKNLEEVMNFKREIMLNLTFTSFRF